MLAASASTNALSPARLWSSCQTCSAIGPLVGHCIAFLHVPLITRYTVKRVQIRQPAKSGGPAKELHRSSTVQATRRLGRGLVSLVVVHGTISNQSAAQQRAGLDHLCDARALRPRGRKLNFWQDFALRLGGNLFRTAPSDLSP